MSRALSAWLALGLVLVGAACRRQLTVGDDTRPCVSDCAIEADGGSSDAGGGVVDAGALDSGSADGGVVDSGAPDAGPLDSGVPDAGTPLCVVGQPNGPLFFIGTVLTPTGAVAGGHVALNDAGVITCVGQCDAGAHTVVSCPDAVIAPGFIDLHARTELNPQGPSAQTSERFEHRHDWRTGARGHTAIATTTASANELAWAELRAVMNGTTSMAGAVASPGLARNLDSLTAREGLAGPQVDHAPFPLDDAAGLLRTADCNYGPMPLLTTSVATSAAMLLHVAEGIDDAARNEFVCVSSSDADVTPPGLSRPLLGPQVAVLHGVGLEARDFNRLVDAGASLVWSPRSNLALYGDTASANVAARMGVRVVLGTDGVAHGSATMARELACAQTVSRAHWANALSDDALLRMVTSRPAELTGTGAQLGAITVGRVADLVVFDGTTRSGVSAPIGAGAADIALVLRGGVPLYGEASTIQALRPVGCDALSVCGAQKAVCLQAEVGLTYPQLQAAVGAAYPAFFCGTPNGEAVCRPERTSTDGGATYTGVSTALDVDGDGVPNASDNCPAIFNPLRPGQGAQANADGDAVGDACDPCPLEADSTFCFPPSPDDLDADNIVNSIDNCISVFNPAQTDVDGDGQGDVCDACPTAAVAVGQPCPATIYDVKNGTLRAGTLVELSDTLVTATTPSGFFVQVKDTDAVFRGADHSGLFVADAGVAGLLPGQRVQLEGVSQLVQTQVQLGQLRRVTITQPVAEPLPQPVTATVSQLSNNGPRATTLDGVLVRTDPVAVSFIDVPNREFTVLSATSAFIAVRDTLTPIGAPALGTQYASLTGVMQYQNRISALLPRTAADFAPAPRALVINEVDYEQNGVDGASFIEVFNGTTAPVSLATLAVVLASGSAEYQRFSLSAAGATLAPGGYLLIRNSTVPANGALTIDTTGDFLENGPNAAVALVDTASTVVLDAVSYGGQVTAQLVGWPAAVSLSEGQLLVSFDFGDATSLARAPNGYDRNDNATDWYLRAPSPGQPSP